MGGVQLSRRTERGGGDEGGRRSRQEVLNPYAAASYKHKYAEQAYNPVTNTYLSPEVEAARTRSESEAAARRLAHYQERHARKATPARGKRMVHGVGRASGRSPITPGSSTSDRIANAEFDREKGRWRVPPPEPVKVNATLLRSEGVSSSLAYGGAAGAGGLGGGGGGYSGDPVPLINNSNRVGKPRVKANPLRNRSSVGDVLSYGQNPLSEGERAAVYRPSRKTGPRSQDRGFNILSHPEPRGRPISTRPW